MQVEMCGKHEPHKQYDQVCQRIIINRKLSLSVNYFEVTIKSISSRSSNCGLWDMWENVDKCGQIWEILSKQCKCLILSVNGQQGKIYLFNQPF